MLNVFFDKLFNTEGFQFLSWIQSSLPLHIFYIDLLYMYKYLAEFFGAVFFIYVILATGNPLAIGAALALTILLTTKVSGGYLNPAVTITMASAGQIATAEIIPYCMAQIFGGLVALELYKRFKL